jgi:uncharacterized protein
MGGKMLFMCTHGKDDSERATLPFVAANVAATAGQEAIVVCTIDGVWLGTKGGTEAIEAKGLPPLVNLFGEFVGRGGKVWLCGACTKPRGITETQVVPGVSIVGAAKVVEEIAAGASAVSFA